MSELPWAEGRRGSSVAGDKTSAGDDTPASVDLSSDARVGEEVVGASPSEPGEESGGGTTRVATAPETPSLGGADAAGVALEPGPTLDVATDG